jgi:pimeloyl-ACP methyl ester carboxylesterase
MVAPPSHVMRSLGSGRDFTPLAARIRTPVLVIYGDRDLVVNPAGARSWARVISEARAWPLRGAGHFAFLEEPDAVVRAIDRFLNGEWPP